MSEVKEFNPIENWRGLLQVKVDLRELAEDETRLLVCLLTGSNEHNDAAFKDELERTSRIYHVVADRIKWAGVEDRIERRLVYWLTVLSNNPAVAVMWVHAAVVRLHELKVKVYTLRNWCEDFPTGVPTEHAMSETWIYQKGLTIKQRFPDSSLPDRIDNAVDHRNWWPDVLKRDLTSNVVLPGEEI